MTYFWGVMKRISVSIYDSFLSCHSEHFKKVLYFFPVFRLLKWKSIQENQFLIITCFIFVSPKCARTIFANFPVFYEWLIWVTEDLLRIHLLVSVTKKGNEWNSLHPILFLNYIVFNIAFNLSHTWLMVRQCLK